MVARSQWCTLDSAIVMRGERLVLFALVVGCILSLGEPQSRWNQEHQDTPSPSPSSFTEHHSHEHERGHQEPLSPPHWGWNGKWGSSTSSRGWAPSFFRLWRGSNKLSFNSTARRTPHWDVWGPTFVPVPIPVPVPTGPVVSPSPINITPAPPPALPSLANTGLVALGLGGIQGSTTSTVGGGGGGPISATVTLTGPGGIPLRSSTTSTQSLLAAAFPALASQLQAVPAGASPAAQAAAQVVAAAQAAYNAQAAYQAQAAEATRAATQAAYAQQAAAVARNAASSLTGGGLSQPLTSLPPF